MTVTHTIARLFGMTDEVWRRHANPWSAHTRIPTLWLLLAAIWSHAWLGPWFLLPVAAVLLWIYLNPRVFSPPTRTNTWASKATFGERVWLNRAAVPIPTHHVQMANVLTAVSGAGFIVALTGAAMNDFILTLGGGLAAFFAKLWFCDRMVWLYDDMKDRHDAYRTWLT